MRPAVRGPARLGARMIKGWTLADVIADPIKHKELIDLAQKRRIASNEFYQPRLDAFIRFYKIYNALKDATDDNDESNTGPSYAFGIIEDATAALSESMLNTRVPTPARKRHVQDEKKADNFNAMAGTYFATGQYQTDYPQSVRERMICGLSWEFDGWASQYRKGKRWKKVDKVDETGNKVTLTEQVDVEEPVKVGYHTRFPSIFLMRPQPRVDSVEKMKWLIEIEERRPLDELREQMVVNEAGEKVPFFSLAAIDEEKKGGKTISPAVIDEKGTDYMAQLHAIQNGVDTSTDNAEQGTADELTLEWCWEDDRVFVVANGLWVIAYIEKPLHRPGIPYRLKGCTPQKHSLYAKGMIEPVEFLLYELDDIHVLSMRQWMRAIHKMIAYNPEAVPFASNDFKRRADGKIRVTPPLGGSVQAQIYELNTDNTAGREMLLAESNNKGLIERSLGMPDFSQGVEGTKQDHDTLGGLQEIKAQAAKRVASIRRQELAGYQKQMWRMEGLFMQFQMEKAPFSFHGPDGSTAMLELDLWDIDTQGRGFDFPIIYDPAFGDDALMRNQKMVLFELSVKYNEAVIAQFPPGTKPLAELDVIIGDTFKAFGYTDTSSVLKAPDGTMKPEEKLQAMLRGEQVMVSPNEDLVACYAYMAAQLMNPQLKLAAETKQAPPDILLRVQAHIQVLQGAIMQALQDPSIVIRAKQYAQPGGQGAPGADGGAVAPRAPKGKGQAQMGPKSPKGRTQ